MKQTFWDEMANTDSEEIKKVAPPGWLAATMPGGGCMMVQVSQIVRVIGEKGPEGRAKLLLANEDLLFTQMSVTDLAEKINHSQNPDSPSLINRTTEVIARMITVAGMIRNLFFRLIVLRVTRPLTTRCLTLFRKRNDGGGLEKTRVSEHSPLEGRAFPRRERPSVR